ncbi:MAG: hypothetical protein CSA81_10365 [Acidobacteria bacterium]|nr:MAG: hypothetical protein CSA81_10365 [Acidobacteriota bacterium]
MGPLRRKRSMSKEVKVMEHQFDGIEEHDNPLPGWWLSIFWIGVAIAIVYPIYYHVLYPEKLTFKKYDLEMAALAEMEASKPVEVVTTQDLMAEYKAGGWQESAAAAFKANCAVCHRADAGGSIGPNFHDDYYIHGGKLENFVKVINEGVLQKGMTPFKGVLKPDQIKHLAFYVRSQRGTPVDNPKEPQGKKVDEEGNFIEEAAPEAAESPEAPAEEAPTPTE